MRIAAYGAALLVCSAICATIIYAPQSRSALVLGLMIFGGAGVFALDQLVVALRLRRRSFHSRLSGPLGATLTLARVRGVAIRAHWSLPLGLFFFSFGGGLVAAAGVTFLVLIHELGHAAVVVRLGYRVRALTFHAFGGECGWDGMATEREEAKIALAGPVAQLVVLGLALLAPRLPRDIRDVLVERNALLIALNLLPIGSLDGATAIRLLRMSPRRARRRPRDEYLN